MLAHCSIVLTPLLLLLQTDKSCVPAHAHKMLPAPTTTPQSYSYKPSGEYPSSTVYVRVVALCKNATSTSPLTKTYPCARGRSVGYLQVLLLSELSGH